MPTHYRYTNSSVSTERDIIVVSDLHLGRGKNMETGRYYRLEAFFYDDDFANFCNHLIDESRIRQKPFLLILNGDTFDLLRIDHDEEPAQSLREKRYGPTLTPAVAVETMEQILEGHKRFTRALATILASGNQVHFLPGNHDIEMQWPPVQAKVRDAVLSSVRDLGGDDEATRAEDNLSFGQWFYYEAGRVWIEHGCQYDHENAFQFYLRKELAAESDELLRAEVDVPLGTFFQKYLYNQFGNITFLVPNSRSNFRYLRWLIINRPRMLARVATKHFPFFWQILRRIASAGTDTKRLRECHEKELDDLARTSGLGERLLAIEDLKRIELSSALLAKRVIARAIKIVAYVLLGAVLISALWTLGAHSIGTATVNVGFKALLFLGLNFTFLVLILVTMLYFLLRPGGPGPDPWLRISADEIAELLGVPLVTFGHTHDEEITALKLKSGGWYFNTGTWIAVFTPDSLLPRERVQYTFLRIRGHEGKLLHWSPARGDAVPVVLIDSNSESEVHPVEV